MEKEKALDRKTLNLVIFINFISFIVLGFIILGFFEYFFGFFSYFFIFFFSTNCFFSVFGGEKLSEFEDFIHKLSGPWSSTLPWLILQKFGSMFLAEGL